MQPTTLSHICVGQQQKSLHKRNARCPHLHNKFATQAQTTMETPTIATSGHGKARQYEAQRDGTHFLRKAGQGTRMLQTTNSREMRFRHQHSRINKQEDKEYYGHDILEVGQACTAAQRAPRHSALRDAGRHP